LPSLHVHVKNTLPVASFQKPPPPQPELVVRRPFVSGSTLPSGTQVAPKSVVFATICQKVGSWCEMR
jgi:hypothetical protein